MAGLLAHLLLTLRLNFRSRMPLIYGYCVPILFLIGFAAIFRGRPPIIHELGQLLTITILGGACFGMPTAMVAERERGIWRRYRLLPMATGAIVLSTMAARWLLIASAVVLQILLAMIVFGMPLPDHPGQLAIAFVFVTWAFVGIGLVIAMIAETVPAVQALGQAIFLPMILIGGVGVPLDVLPNWARIFAGFMPGEYAVDAFDSCAIGSGLGKSGFDLIALAVIGAAACATGTAIFRWDGGRRLSGRQKIMALPAVLAWAAVGLAAEATGQTPIPTPPAYQEITQAQIDSITYDGLADDSSFITPVVWSLDDISPEAKKWAEDFAVTLAAWPPGNVRELDARTRNLLAVAAIADLDEFKYEGEVPYDVFAELKSQADKDQLERILAGIILQPNGGTVPTSAADLGIAGQQDEAAVRDRIGQYAKKLLGHLLGKM
jgi:ABC-type multidrug transport system permease subunit